MCGFSKSSHLCLTNLSAGKVMMEEEVKEEIKEEMETHAGPEEGKFVTLYCVIRD